MAPKRPIEEEPALKMLLNRVPRPFYRPAPTYPLIKPCLQSDYESLAHEFGQIQSELFPEYERLDQAALIDQHKYRLQITSVIVLGAVATIAGGLQSVYEDAASVLGAIELALGVLLIVLAQALRRGNTQKGYVQSRLAAERLRGEAFLYLTGSGTYEKSTDRDAELVRRVGVLKQEAAK